MTTVLRRIVRYSGKADRVSLPLRSETYDVRCANDVARLDSARNAKGG
jgi:hypothetical protein